MIDHTSLTLVLLAPLDGWASPLGDVPDPVFAEKMMGDGLAIDPVSGELCAPCDGEIIQLHRAGHAVTLLSANGAEILIHIGLETVALNGAGFTVHVKPGDRVKAGDRLISVDLDPVARGAKSLITPIVITNGDDFTLERHIESGAVRRGQKLLTLRRQAAAAAVSSGAMTDYRRAVIVPLAHGIHARPAARLADLAKSFAAELQVEAGGKRANLRSPVALMGLGLSKGAEALLIGRGADAEQAVDKLIALIESGMGERDDHPAPAAAIEPAPVQATEAGALAGVRAAPGMTLGIAVPLTLADIAVTEQGKGIAAETQALDQALTSVTARLRIGSHSGGAGAAIMAAHLGFLEDPELRSDAARHIDSGKSAGFAWRSAIAAQTDILRKLTDPRFVERIADLLDLERQVLVALGGAPADGIALPDGAILLADDLLPSQLVGLDAGKLAGIATAKGGPTSHVAILAASMNIPALVACGPALLQIAKGTALLLDATAGKLTIDPDADIIATARQQIESRREQRAAAQAKAHELCHTKDGERVEIAANLGSLKDAKAAMAAGAEGCGLLRTEFLFLERQSPPDEEEQTEVYRAIAEELDGRPLIVRTLDIGGDKPADYLPIPAEENPALGLRGVRVSLWRPDLLTIQLRAILRGVPAAQCRIMVPMIASLSELRQVRAILDQVKIGLGITDRISLGVMVETPAAAMTTDILAREADFLSIGTNDLTQYTLAMDRGNPSVAAEIDALHPAVLRLIAATAEGGAKHGRWTGVCGGLASDLAAAPILIGLGVRELSATSGQIADIKALVRGVTLAQCRDLAERALAASAPDDVRQLTLSAGDL